MAALKRSSQSDSVFMSPGGFVLSLTQGSVAGVRWVGTASTTEAKALACLHECWLASVGVAMLAT